MIIQDGRRFIFMRRIMGNKLFKRILIVAFCLALAFSVSPELGTKEVYAATVMVSKPAKIQAVLYNYQNNSSGAYRSIRLTWSKVANATGYIVYYWRQGDTSMKTYTLKKNSPALNFLNQTAGKRYYYYVRAYRNYGGKTYYSAKSNTVGITTLSKPSSRPKVTKAADQYVKVVWPKVQGATAYQVSCYTDVSKAKVVATVSQKYLSRYVKPSYKNRLMYYRVRGIVQYKMSNGGIKTIYGPWSDATAFILR